jgi:transposase
VKTDVFTGGIGMAIYVRKLNEKEGNELLRVSRRGTHPVCVRRSLVILASAQRMKVPEISRLYHMSKEHIRTIIHRFNKEGIECIYPRYRGGRPPTFSSEDRVRIVELAQTPPKTLGLPFTGWSLRKLRAEVEKRGIVSSISIETLRGILNEAEITYQHTKTWKESNDPEYEVKKNESNSFTVTRQKTVG